MKQPQSSRINAAAIQFYLASAVRQVAQDSLKRAYLIQRGQLGIYGHIEIESPEFEALAKATSKEFAVLEKAKRRERYTKSKLLSLCKESIASKLLPQEPRSLA